MRVNFGGIIFLSFYFFTFLSYERKWIHPTSGCPRNAAARLYCSRDCQRLWFRQGLWFRIASMSGWARTSQKHDDICFLRWTYPLSFYGDDRGTGHSWSQFSKVTSGFSRVVWLIRRATVPYQSLEDKVHRSEQSTYLYWSSISWIWKGSISWFVYQVSWWDR